MLDAVKFVKRLEMILSHYELSAASFAERIGVQRSSISHLLNGRNKPSLEFVIKITETFPEVGLQWLLFGNGAFPNDFTVADPIKIKRDTKQTTPNLSQDTTIERIVIFYVDGTFKNYSVP